MADTACPISAETWESACWSAWAAVEAAEVVMSGDPAAYALCRPPGHHAFADVAGGFCFINNSAVAAQRLRKGAARVAILDVDLHHGNGTQGIFYARSDVLTVSIHADPVRFIRSSGAMPTSAARAPVLATITICRWCANPATRCSWKRSLPQGAALKLSRRKRWSWHWGSMLSRATVWRTLRFYARFCPHCRSHREIAPANGYRAGGRLSLRRARRQPYLVPQWFWRCGLIFFFADKRSVGVENHRKTGARHLILKVYPQVGLLDLGSLEFL